ncbi:disease resistance protein RPM1 [Morus notabilis]|uniref:disease resistance protein RPM1 n=1 Tax=Morus notabilis TaxID=981085 RepID=UPI000CED0B08|nr:disease resistance protein RPM1 [Morus notabilis]
MAETAVGLVIDKLIPLLTEEAYLLRGVENDVEEIKCDLDFLSAFLNDADTRAEREIDQRTSNSIGVKIWVQKLRKEAFELEDVIDEYTHLMAQQRHPHKHRFIGFLRSSVCLIIKLKPRHNIASKIKDIKQRIRDINDKRATYGFNSTLNGLATAAQQTTWYDPRKDSLFLQETEVMGIDSIRDKLIERLEDKSHNREVITLVGMGGLGKTTLANQIYYCVKGRFDYHAWVEVSQSYDNAELLRKLMKKFFQEREEPVPMEIDTMDESTVTTKLKDYLQGKSYIVVFDDVWNVSFWDGVKNALPYKNEQCRGIIITTRDVKVANSCKRSTSVYIHHMEPLHQETAWELFCNRAFQYDFEGHCPADLEKLSLEILTRCEGLPLAIVVIAGVLSTKSKTPEEWQKFRTTLSSELESNEHLASIDKILSLSYNNLPYYLKSCFLYFGIFPEHYSIRCRRLIRQWIAEGFVNKKKDKTLEVVAGEYLTELINRSLVQVSEVDFDGKPRSCRIHDLLREIVVKKMEDLHFCKVLSRSDTTFKGFTRRLSILHSSSDAFESFSKTSHVRSLFVFVKDEIPVSLPSVISTNFKLLKVLDFEYVPSLDNLPEDVGNLFFLRYLSVRGTRVMFLPKAIGKLENLETLDLKRSLVHEIPAEINRLHKLRHLLGYHFDEKADWSINSVRGVKIQKGIRRLRALQKLYFIEANTIGIDVFRELRELRELRKLGIKKLRSEDGRAMCDCIQEMEHLESLSICSTREDEKIDLECLSSPPQFLRRLYLKGHLGKLPEWIPKLQYLVRIRISWSKLEDDLIETLQNLQNLLEIGLFHDAYYGEKLHFKVGTFGKLKVLNMMSLNRLNSISIEEGALCNLEELSIGPCPELKKMPLGFQHLRNLKLLRFSEMPPEFMMFQNFQSVEKVLDVRFLFHLSGELLFLPLKTMLEMQKHMQG